MPGFLPQDLGASFVELRDTTVASNRAALRDLCFEILLFDDLQESIVSAMNWGEVQSRIFHVRVGHLLHLLDTATTAAKFAFARILCDQIAAMLAAVPIGEAVALRVSGAQVPA